MPGNAALERSVALVPMDPVDAAWYHMDGPERPAIITAVLLTRRRLDFAKVLALYRERLLGFERFRQRVVERGLPYATPHWEDVDDFVLERHLHHVALPAPGGERELQQHIADAASMPLDPALPLWQVQVIDNVMGGGALLMRCHHCIADGTAMMTVASRLFDAPGRPVPAAAAKRRPTAAPAPTWLTPALEPMERGARALIGAVADPGALLAAAGLVVDGAQSLLRDLLVPVDPPSPLKGAPGSAQRVAWSEPVAIREVKAIGRRHDAKVNDVLIAAMTGALRAYLRRRGVDVDHTRLHAMVPVDLRTPGQRGELGNRFGLVILELAVDCGRRARCLALTRQRMGALKRSAEPLAMRTLLDLFGRLPKAVEDVASDIFGSRTSVVMTNVAVTTRFGREFAALRRQAEAVQR